MALVILAAPYCVQLALIQEAWAREPAPVIEAAGEPGLSASSAKEMEARIVRLERLLENQTLIEMAMRMDSLQNEVQQLLGQMEEQSHTMGQLKKRQRDLYLDIDQRLRQMEEASAKAAAAAESAAMGNSMSGGIMPGGTMLGGNVLGASAPTVSAPDASMPAMGAAAMLTPGAEVTSAAQDTVAPVDPLQERTDYERAFNLLKEGRYDLAATAFKTFVQTYPKGQFADNAQYWLGEASYVQRQFKIALAEFEKVVNNYPTSPKRADALLKMGYTYQELEQYDKARLSLNNVIMTYPNTTAASLAQKRLQDLKRFQ
jgi:tol-pal system protein YbgF